jgi:hypothetical protein
LITLINPELALIVPIDFDGVAKVYYPIVVHCTELVEDCGSSELV